MSHYRYVALDAAGRRQRGEIEAEHPRAARARLREMGLLPETVHTRDAGARAGGMLGGRVSAMELALFSRQFATLLRAGLTIEKSFAALADQPEQAGLRAVLVEAREDVLAGHNLASALERQPRAFPAYYAAIVRAGEEAGALPAVMERLADSLERGQALRHKVGAALIYPAIVTVVALLVIGVLLTYVVPQVVAVFEHGRQTLPWLTRALIAVSDAVRASAWIVLPGLVVAAFLAVRLLALEPVRARWHRFLLDLPVIGRLRSGLATARFADTLAVLSASGVPVVSALHHAAAALDDRVFRQAVREAALRVREGMGISRALRESGAFPPLLVHLVASGEASGELPRVLEQAARQQELAVGARLTTLTALLEPLLILIMGGVVLVIVLATLEPIIEMNRMLR